jgi:hypothetical protein
MNNVAPQAAPVIGFSRCGRFSRESYRQALNDTYQRAAFTLMWMEAAGLKCLWAVNLIAWYREYEQGRDLQVVQVNASYAMAATLACLHLQP